MSCFLLVEFLRPRQKERYLDTSIKVSIVVALCSVQKNCTCLCEFVNIFFLFRYSTGTSLCMYGGVSFLYTISTLQKTTALVFYLIESVALWRFAPLLTYIYICALSVHMSAVQIRVRHIRNFFYSFRSESKQIWIFFASYSHVFGIFANFASNWRIFASKYLFRSKYSQNL